MHSRRCYVSVVELNGFIYAMGGFNGEMRLNSVERYDPATNQWTLIESMNYVSSCELTFFEENNIKTSFID